MDDEPEEIPKQGEELYKNADALLPKGDKRVWGQVVHQKWGADGNPIGKFKENTNLDKCLYEVKFSGGEVIEFIANIIAESLYAQCDVVFNEYLLLPSFFDHRKSDKGLSLEDQMIMV